MKKNLTQKENTIYPTNKIVWFSKINLLIIFVITTLFFQCKKTEFAGETKGVCPEVVSTDPANAAVGVPTNKIVVVTFNTPMNGSTFTSSTFYVKQGTTVIAGTITSSGKTAVFTPTVNFSSNTLYTATVKAGVKDLEKNAMIADYVWSFTTGTAPDIIPPTVISTDPVNNATGVTHNKVIVANFSESMNPTTINSLTFLLKQGTTAVSGTVSYSGVSATFTPSVNLLPSTTYNATITTGAQDLSGNAITTNYVWSFTTGTTPPTVVSTDPINNATGVSLNKVIVANFSTAMNASTINSLTYMLKQGTTAVAGTVSYSGVSASFTPSANLLPSTTYNATITTGAQDVTGNAIVTNYVWSFTTGTIPPTVVSTDPINNATGVSLNKVIVANFSTAMNATTINSLTYLLKQGTTAVAGTVSYSGVSASFTPSANLLPNTTYNATITTGAQNVSGTAIASNYNWSFTTAGIVLGTAANFGSFGGNAGVTNQGLNTVINNGSIGTTAASTLITGFHDGLTADVYTETPLNVGNVTGGIFTAPPFPGTAVKFAIAQQALADANVAYLSMSPASKPGGTDPGAGELGGLTLAPGVYKSASGTFNISNGNLTLDAQGNPNATWIFQTAAGLTVGIAGPTGAKSVILINGAQPKNVFWYVGSTAIINGAGGGVMVGTIIASSGVSFSTAGNAVQTVLNGRALSLVASVTMVNTTINNQ